MRQLIKIFSGIALLALGLQSARAWVPIGPVDIGGDNWQTGDLGYNPNIYIDLLATGPKNFGEEYRRNIPVLYYACDATFLNYFGSNGPVPIDAAFAILNNSFTYTNSMATNGVGVDGYTSLLSEFPLESRQTKYEAQALGMLDLKSYTLGLMMEQLGLATPERYTWILHDRFHVTPGPPCPAGQEYLVVQRNLGITTSALNQPPYSPYINNTLYNYFIDEFCTTVASGRAPLLATTEPLAADPTADTYSPVADFGNIPGDIGYGDFYNALTRDDIAGIRYLYDTNNYNFESAPAGSLLMTTNIGTAAQEQLLTTVDLGALLAAATTNAPAVVQTLYPNVVVANSTFTFSAVRTPIVTTYFTNYIGAPYGSAQITVIVTNYIFLPQTNYSDVYANVITNGNLAGNPSIVNPGGYTLNYSPNTAATLLTTTLAAPPGSPYGSPVVTNTTVQSFTQAGVPSGEYFVIPSGQCGWEIVPTAGFPIAGQPVYTTNIISTATNTPVATTNGVVTNSTTGFVSTQSIVTSFTSHTYVVEPIICSSAAAPAGIYQGDGKIQFVRANYDSLFGQTFQPITNYFTKVLLTNSQLVTQHFQRVVTAPDFTFTAGDLAEVTATGFETYRDGRNLNFDQGNILPGLAGPGVIDSPTTFTFDNAEPVYFNNSTTPEMYGTPYFTGYNLGDPYYDYYFVWAQFDGTTNEPVVFPNGTSLANLENEAVVQITPGGPLPDGTSGAAYPAVTFNATGGSFIPPFTWSWVPVGSETLPPGLALSSGGTLSGVPSQSGTFDFTIQLTDSLSRSVQWQYSITIH